jgi:hypothetical protein
MRRMKIHKQIGSSFYDTFARNPQKVRSDTIFTVVQKAVETG